MSKIIFLLALVALATASVCSASIEKEPVKVTHHNSGPSYDISEDVEKVKVPSSSSNEDNDDDSAGRGFRFTPPPSSSEESANGNNDDDASIGHITIRRIFLVPISSSASSPSSSQQDDNEPRRSLQPWSSMMQPREPSPSSMFPHFLFSNPSRPFGQRSPFDTLSSPPKVDKPGEETEREEASSLDRPMSSQPNINPIQLLLEMMRSMHEMQPNRENTDLNKAASGESENKPTEGMKPPTRTNETREDIVEIDGKKFVRKVEIKKHIGENMVFITRRFVFVPLNETDSESKPSTVTPISISTPTTELPATSPAPVATSTERKLEVEATTTVAQSDTPPKKLDTTERVDLSAKQDAPTESPTTPKP